MGQLETRLEKITFLVQEIDLASHLAQLCAANDELARIWARRAVIRCADLIDHTEAVRRDMIALDASAYPPLKRPASHTRRSSKTNSESFAIESLRMRRTSVSSSASSSGTGSTPPT